MKFTVTAIASSVASLALAHPVEKNSEGSSADVAVHAVSPAANKHARPSVQDAVAAAITKDADTKNEEKTKKNTVKSIYVGLTTTVGNINSTISKPGDISNARKRSSKSASALRRQYIDDSDEESDDESSIYNTTSDETTTSEEGTTSGVDDDSTSGINDSETSGWDSFDDSDDDDFTKKSLAMVKRAQLQKRLHCPKIFGCRNPYFIPGPGPPRKRWAVPHIKHCPPGPCRRFRYSDGSWP